MPPNKLFLGVSESAQGKTKPYTCRGGTSFEEEEIRIVAKKGIEGVPDWQPKDFDARTIPIPSATVELLSALRIEAGFGSKMVFVSSLRLAWMRQQRGAGKWTEGQATLNNLNRAFGVIAKRAGVDDVCLHDLRRSCLTHWARKLPSHVTKELAGHSSIETTLRYYVSTREDDMSQARDAVALALLSDAKRTQTA